MPVGNRGNYMRSILRSLFAFTILLLTITTVHAAQSSVSAASIVFEIVDSKSGAPVSNATILFDGSSSIDQTTDGNGTTTLTLPYGTYNLTVSNADCSDFGPQLFTADQYAPKTIMAKLDCNQATSTTPAQESPTLHTDKSQYTVNDTIYWNVAGFTRGAYLQACVGQLCGGVTEADSQGGLTGSFALDHRTTVGNQTLTVTNIITGSYGTTQITISS